MRRKTGGFELYFPPARRSWSRKRKNGDGIKDYNFISPSSRGSEGGFVRSREGLDAAKLLTRKVATSGCSYAAGKRAKRSSETGRRAAALSGSRGNARKIQPKVSGQLRKKAKREETQKALLRRFKRAAAKTLSSEKKPGGRDRSC